MALGRAPHAVLVSISQERGNSHAVTVVPEAMPQVGATQAALHAQPANFQATVQPHAAFVPVARIVQQEQVPVSIALQATTSLTLKVDHVLNALQVLTNLTAAPPSAYLALQVLCQVLVLLLV